MVATHEEARTCWLDNDALWKCASRKGVARGNASALAVLLGVAPQTMSRVLSGERQAGHSLLMRIRLAFGDRAFLEIWRCRGD